MERFARAGKARALGISNFNSSLVEALLTHSLRVKPAINQCGFSIGGHNRSVYGRDLETLATCKKHGGPERGLVKYAPTTSPDRHTPSGTTVE